MKILLQLFSRQSREVSQFHPERRVIGRGLEPVAFYTHRIAEAEQWRAL